MNTQLHELMHDAVKETHPDLGALAHQARRRGLGIRRRRQSLGLVGSAFAVTVIAAGSLQLAGRWDTNEAAATAPVPTLRVDRQVPMTGRAVAAGLQDALRAQVPATSDTFTDVEGQSGYEAYSGLHYHPGGGGYSLVGINIQPDFDAPSIYRCRDWQLNCKIVHPTEGATLMTFEEHTPSPDGLGILVVADLLRADGVRVVASAANGEKLAGNRWRITRDRPPLSAAQLSLVVSEPWWGPTMDERFVEQGKRLTSYTDLDADRGDWVRGTPGDKP